MKTRKELITTSLISITGSVGCVTVIILLGAVFGGMWLDDLMGTKPTWTVILLLAAIPLSVIAMVFTARSVIRHIQKDLEKDQKNQLTKENLTRGS